MQMEYDYVHDGSETISDSFTYQAMDSEGALSEVTPVTITITPVNDAPTAINDGITILEGATKVVPVLSNDTDTELDTLSVQVLTAPTNGTAVVNADNTITYTHAGDQTTSDSLIYSIDDGNGGTATAALLIAINPVNDNPVALTDNAVVFEQGSVMIDVLANDSDEESVSLSTTIVDQPSYGSLIQNADGTYLYTHDGSETTSDSFSYQVSDAQGAASVTTQVLIDVIPVNDAPIASDDTSTHQWFCVGECGWGY